jgi:hypothetical protein
MSYSKIRHIRNSNIILENRLFINEQKVVNEIDLQNGFKLQIRKNLGSNPKKPFKSYFRIFFETPTDFVKRPGDVGGGLVFPEIYSVNIPSEFKGESHYGYPTLEDTIKIAEEIAKSNEMKRKIDYYLLYKNQKKSTGSVSDAELVTNKNPFNYQEFSVARRAYSEDLKDGDLFTEWVKNIATLLLERVNDSLKGKTVKITDENKNQEIITFGLDRNGAHGVRINKDFGQINEGKKIIQFMNFYASNNGVSVDFRFDFENNKYEIVQGKKILGMNDPVNATITNRWVSRDIQPDSWQSNLYNYLNQNFQDVKKYPDNFFNIEKVVKQKTDFKP